MNPIDISMKLRALASVSDDALRAELKRFRLGVSDEKFHTAFSCYGASKLLAQLSLTHFQTRTDIPERAARQIQHSSSLVFRMFSAFCYMRSDTLERGLETVDPSSDLRHFRDIYRAGKKGEMTLVQHVRNSLSHGSFSIKQDFVQFEDRNERFAVRTEQLVGLAEHVFRFYEGAIRAGHAEYT